MLRTISWTVSRLAALSVVFVVHRGTAFSQSPGWRQLAAPGFVHGHISLGAHANSLFTLNAGATTVAVDGTLRTSWRPYRLGPDEGSWTPLPSFEAQSGRPWSVVDPASGELFAVVGPTDGRVDIATFAGDRWTVQSGILPHAAPWVTVLVHARRVYALTEITNAAGPVILIDPGSGATEVVGTLPHASPADGGYAATSAGIFSLVGPELWRWDWSTNSGALVGRIPDGPPARRCQVLAVGETLFLLSRDPSHLGRDPTLHRLRVEPFALEEWDRGSPPPIFEGRLDVVSTHARGYFVHFGHEALPQLWTYEASSEESQRTPPFAPDVRLDWTLEALADERATEPWVEATLTALRPSVALWHLARHPRGQRLTVRWRLLQALRQRERVDCGLFWQVPFELLVAEAKALWPLELEPLSRDGAYEWTVRARSVAGQVAHDVLVLAIDHRGTEQETLRFVTTERERLFLFALAEPWIRQYVGGILQIDRQNYLEEGGGFPAGRCRGFARSLPTGMDLPRVTLEDPGSFLSNGSPLPDAALQHIPSAYR